MEKRSSNKPLAVLCDFDGTATPQVVPYLLYKKFGDQTCEQYKQQWERGEITTPQELEGCFSRLYPLRDEMEAYLDTIPLSIGFEELVSWCRSEGHAFAILSDGLKWYINHILENYGFHDILIYANEIHFNEDGAEIESPWYSQKWPMRGTGKPDIVMRYQRQDYDVAFIGDGRSDFEVAGYADHLFAKDHFLEYCKKEGYSAVPVSDLTEVAGHFKTSGED